MNVFRNSTGRWNNRLGIWLQRLPCSFGLRRCVQLSRLKTSAITCVMRTPVSGQGARLSREKLTLDYSSTSCRAVKLSHRFFFPGLWSFIAFITRSKGHHVFWHSPNQQPCPEMLIISIFLCPRWLQENTLTCFLCKLTNAGWCDLQFICLFFC